MQTVFASSFSFLLCPLNLHHRSTTLRHHVLIPRFRGFPRRPLARLHWRRRPGHVIAVEWYLGKFDPCWNQRGRTTALSLELLPEIHALARCSSLIL